MSITNLIIVTLIIICLCVHRYLSFFWERKELRYPRGFLLFANTFVILYLVNFIYIFGPKIGVSLFLISFFQILYLSFLWPTMIPFLIKVNKNNEIPKVNDYVYGSWSWLVIVLFILTVGNLIFSEYNPTLMQEIFDVNTLILIISLAITGNIFRELTMKYL